SFVLSLGPTVLASALGQDSALLAGATACVMFLVATGIQFALAHLTTRSHLVFSSIAAIAAMTLLMLTVTAWPSPTLFVAVAILAGTAQGLGQLSGLTLIATNVPDARRAEGNAALNIAGYIPAALIPVATGYLIDTTGLATAIVVFAAVLTTASVVALTIVRRTPTTREAGR
ncbi:MAG: MFS transporter, partial [Actinomycetota bacterium]|nr:MFS transporter [Actinomycetota bacterium]